jgi:hypothetical protein
MRTFELNIFIDRPRIEVYNHIAEPINMIGLQPFLTSIDVLKEQKDGDGIVLRPYYTVETHRWLGLPIRRSRRYSVIHLTKPHSELEVHVFKKQSIQYILYYLFRDSEEGRTHLTQKFRLDQVSKLRENQVFEQANKSQRGLLANLKVRLEKS